MNEQQETTEQGKSDKSALLAEQLRRMKMADHELKTDRDVFQATWQGIKNFEIRLNDRNFMPGDTLTLKETEYSGEQMRLGMPLEYTGREIKQEVNYVLHGPAYGLVDGWVILDVTTLEMEYVD